MRTIDVSRIHLGGRFVLLLLLAFSSGCSTFERDWRKAGELSTPSMAIEGRWEGRWLSAVNGHTGRLRCVLNRVDGERYRARYHATFWKVFSYSYAVEMEARENLGVFEFNANADLGYFAGGEYKYAGRATATNFFSTYESKHDHGTFQMARPSAAGR